MAEILKTNEEYLQEVIKSETINDLQDKLSNLHDCLKEINRKIKIVKIKKDWLKVEADGFKKDYEYYDICKNVRESYDSGFVIEKQTAILKKLDKKVESILTEIGDNNYVLAILEGRKIEILKNIDSLEIEMSVLEKDEQSKKIKTKKRRKKIEYINRFLDCLLLVVYFYMACLSGFLFFGIDYSFWPVFLSLVFMGAVLLGSLFVR